MAGTVTFAAGTMTRAVEETWKGTMHFSPACLTDMLSEEIESVNTAVCERMERQSGSTKSAKCAVVSGSCDCEVVGSKEDTSDESYVLEGNQIVRPGGEGPRRDYCVSGRTLKFKEVSQDLPNFAIITTLERR